MTGVAAIGTAFLIFAGDKVITIYSSNPAVLANVQRILPMVIISHIYDVVIMGTHSGLRSLGRQITGYVINIIVYWVSGVPIGLYMALYLGWELTGLWSGFMTALAL